MKPDKKEIRVVYPAEFLSWFRREMEACRAWNPQTMTADNGSGYKLCNNTGDEVWRIRFDSTRIVFVSAERILHIRAGLRFDMLQGRLEVF